MAHGNMSLVLAALVLPMASAGCVTPPSPHSEVEVIAVRTDANNQVVEKLTKKHSYWSYANLFTPNGVEHYSYSSKNHYYLTDGQGKKKALKFLDQRGGHAQIYPVWFALKPVEGTNCWVRVERLYDHGGDDPRARTLFITVFNSERMLQKRKMETSEYIGSYHYEDHLQFGSGNRSVSWNTDKDHFSYDVMQDILTGPNTAESTEKK